MTSKLSGFLDIRGPGFVSTSSNTRSLGWYILYDEYTCGRKYWCEIQLPLYVSVYNFLIKNEFIKLRESMAYFHAEIRQKLIRPLIDFPAIISWNTRELNFPQSSYSIVLFEYGRFLLCILERITFDFIRTWLYIKRPCRIDRRRARKRGMRNVHPCIDLDIRKIRALNSQKSFNGCDSTYTCSVWLCRTKGRPTKLRRMLTSRSSFEPTKLINKLYEWHIK